ncbi:MAG: hypothetical protein JJ964_13100 [Rhizobiales bacterium]|nr:hypothetical protein [Hyphomicrobiales bacterium]
MNDDNHNNPPTWVRSIHSQPHDGSKGQALDQQAAAKDMTGQDAAAHEMIGHFQDENGAVYTHQDAALNQSQFSQTEPHEAVHNNGRPKKQVSNQSFFSRVKSRIFKFGDACHYWISMIGHCALVCGDACADQLSKKPQSRSRPFAFLGLGIVFIFSVLAFGSYYAMGYRSLPVNFLKTSIETTLSSAFAGGSVRIDQALLQRDVQNGGLFVRLVNLDLRDEGGSKIAATPEIGVGLKFFPLLWGEVEPSSINILSPEIHFVRNEKREWTFWRGKGVSTNSTLDKASLGSERDKSGEDVISQNGMPVDFARIGDLAKEGLMKAHSQLKLSFPLSHIGVRNARVVLHEGKLDKGDVWRVPTFTLQYDPAGDKKIIGNGVIEHTTSPGAALWVSFTHREGAQFVDLKTRLQNVIPSELSSLVPVLSSLKAVQLGVSGDMAARIDLNEGVTSGNLKVALSDGYIGLLGDEGPRFAISRGAFVFDMEPGAKHIVLRQGELFYPNGNISLKGDVWRDNQKDELPDWRFQLYSTSGQIISDYSDVNGSAIDEFNFSGRLFGSRAPVVIDEFRAKIGEGQIILAHDGSLGYPAVLRGRVTNVSTNLLKSIWPEGFNQESRDWVFKNVKEGVVTSARLALQAPDFGERALLAGEKKANLELPFMDVDVKGVVFTVFDDPMIIKTRQANLQIKGKTLVAKMKRARSSLGKGRVVEFTDGKLTIPDYEPKGPDGIVEFKFKTNTQFVDHFLKREPFSQKRTLSDHAKYFDGELTGALKVNLPLVEEVDPKDVVVNGNMQLGEVKAQFGKFKLSNGLIKFNLGKNYIEAKGNVLINGVASKLSWDRKLLAGVDHSDQLKVTGVFDDADRNQLGLPVNSFVNGAVPVELLISENKSNQFDMHVLADLRKATLRAKHLGWQKDAGVPATLNVDIISNKEGGVSLINMKLDGRDLTVRGDIQMDETHQVTSFSFPNISYKVLSNIHVEGALNNKKIWQISAGGKTFDGRGLLKSLLRTGKVGAGGKAKDLSKGIDLKAEFDTVLGWKQSKLSRFKINMSRRGDVMTDFKIKGTLLNGGSLTGNLVSGKNAAPVIRLRSSDTGEALRFVGFYPNMLGGQGQLKVRYNVGKRQLAAQTGELIISRFSIASDPVVKEVLSNISQGKSGRSSNEQDIIKFNRLYAPFSIGQGQFVLHDSQVKGELLGATMRGSIDFDKERLRLGGTYIPLYGLNAAVGVVPVLGDILVGRRGEGMLGITFGIYGSTKNPQVLVNPMSLVAPGVFRQIFEFEQGGQNIKVRPNTKTGKGVKLDSSASRVIRRKKNGDDANNLSPETSASTVRRRSKSN